MPVETEKTSAISTAEIEQDIRDTEQEIAVMEGELRAYEMVPPGSADFRMAVFRAGARRDGIRQRRDFIAKLRALLAERSEGHQPDSPEER